MAVLWGLRSSAPAKAFTTLRVRVRINQECMFFYIFGSRLQYFLRTASESTEARPTAGRILQKKYQKPSPNSKEEGKNLQKPLIMPYLKATGKPKEVITVVGEKFEEKLKEIDFSEVHLTVNEDDVFMFTSEKRNGSIKKIKELLDSEIDNARKSFRHDIPSECSFLFFNIYSKLNTNDFEKIFAVFSRNNLINEKIEKKKKGGKKNED